MINPYRLVTIGASNVAASTIGFHYDAGSWRMNCDVLSTSSTTQASEAYQSTGLRKPTHSITLLLQNDMVSTAGESYAGASWTAQTQLNHLRAIWGASRYSTGYSVPFLFVAPNGETFTVAPVGGFNASEYLKVAGASGVEYRLELSMQTI